MLPSTVSLGRLPGIVGVGLSDCACASDAPIASDAPMKALKRKAIKYLLFFMFIFIELFQLTNFDIISLSMAVMELGNMKAALTKDQRLLGLDLGTKTIGVALSDTTRTIASPFETLKHTKFTADATRLKQIIDEHNVGGLVIGLPVSMDGTEGPRCQSARTFAINLFNKFEIMVSFWDERLSTSAIERVLVGDVDMTRKRRKEVVDKLAATYILQGALDAVSLDNKG